MRDANASPTRQRLIADVRERAEALVAVAQDRGEGETRFADIEKALLPLLFALAQAVVALFLGASKERLLAQLPSRWPSHRCRRAAADTAGSSTQDRPR